MLPHLMRFCCVPCRGCQYRHPSLSLRHVPDAALSYSVNLCGVLTQLMQQLTVSCSCVCLLMLDIACWLAVSDTLMLPYM